MADTIRKEHYEYSNNFTLGAGVGAQIQDTIKISADANFVIKRISITTSDNLKNDTIFVRDSSSSKEWFQNPIRIDNYSGNYADNSSPKFLFQPKRIMANCSIEFTFTNTGGVARTIQVVLEGYREIITRA